MLLACVTVQVARGQSGSQQFGGAYADLDPRRQALIADWFTRFNLTTGQQLDSAAAYDSLLSVSTKATFDAVSHALITTPLTDASGASLGDALGLIERVNAVRGEIPGKPGDRQFRMYVRLKEDARNVLERSREFRRAADNTIYHHGYPLNYREQNGAPSIQISIALDNRRADIDVDYRSSSFPAAMFNGHLTASNSDVRAGNNADRHAGRWEGFRNWWNGFLGIRLTRQPSAESSPMPLSRTPRAGKQDIDVMVQDFLHAWLVEGDVIAAMGYFAPRASACVAEEADDPSAVDLGMVPFQVMARLKAAREALGPHESLEGLVVGVRLALPELKVLQQPHHAQFVIYAVPDDIAAGFDCATRIQPGAKRASRTYGNYYGSVFYVNGAQDQRVAILWAKDDGYWKIAAWRIGVDDAGETPSEPPVPALVRIEAEPTLVNAAHAFAEEWLVRKNYDAAFRYLTPASYACYDLARADDQPPSTSPEDAAAKIRAALQRAGEALGRVGSLDGVIAPADPLHPAVRLMEHRYQNAFSLMSLPDALGDAAECAARTHGFAVPDPLPMDYGKAFAMTFRLGTANGDAPVLRLLWRRAEGDWRITSFDVEVP